MRTEIEFTTREGAIRYADSRRAEKNPGESVVFRNTMIPRVIITRAHVGDPATYGIGLDRYPADIITVKGARITIRRRNSGIEMTFTRRKNGRFRPTGSICGSLIIGTADSYLDPSF